MRNKRHPCEIYGPVFVNNFPGGLFLPRILPNFYPVAGQTSLLHRRQIKILAQLKNTWDTEQLKIHMHRKDYAAAATVLTEGRYPLHTWDSDYKIQTAQRLESRFPEEILKYYLSGLGNMKTNAVRKEYTRKAHVMSKIRRLLVEVLYDKARWRAFAIRIKQDNFKRPAFQEEFAKAVSGWRELK